MNWFSHSRKIGLATLGGAAAALPLIAGCATAPNSSQAGWMAKGAVFTNVSQLFQVPRVTCDGVNRQVYFSIGYDMTGSAPERVGLKVSCAQAGSAAVYSAFYQSSRVGLRTLALLPSNSKETSIRPGSYLLFNMLSEPGAGAHSERQFRYEIGDFPTLNSQLPNASNEGNLTSAGASDDAGCLVLSGTAGMPHFGAIKLADCGVSSPTGSWDISGPIKPEAPGEFKPGFTNIGYKMVKATSSTIRVAVTDENADGSYSVLQLTP